MQCWCSIWKILHLQEYFYTGTAHGARNNYQVWVHDAVIRNVWRPQKLERQMACNPNAAWDGLKIFGMDTPRLDEDEGVVALDNPPGTNSFQNYIYIYTSQMLCHIIIKWFITKCSVARREGDGAQHRGGGSDPWGEHLLCHRYTYVPSI